MASSTLNTRQDLHVEISERLGAMRDQEAKYYAVPDYLAADWQRRLRETTGTDADQESSSPTSAASSPSAMDPLVSNNAATAAGGGVGMNPQDGGSSSGGSSQINELWREKICEWCYQVVDHFDFNREVVSVAMSYLDRYLATRTVNRRIFQLAAMTALYLAIKLYEPGKLRMSSLIDLSRGYFMSEHIVAMEDSMLQSLGWHVHPPTSFAFCRDFVKLVPDEGIASPRAKHDVTELSRFLTELAVCDYWFATRRASSVALAAIINAVELQGSRRVDPRTKVEFLHRVVDAGVDIAGDEEIIECYERLREMYIAGGYSPGLGTEDEAEQDLGERVATVSPTNVADGADSGLVGEDSQDWEEVSHMECA